MKKTFWDVVHLVADAIAGAIWLARASVLFVFEFFANQWRQYNPFGQALFVVAVGMTAIDAAISYRYGSRQTDLHAWAFAGIMVAFAVMPDVSISELRKKNVPGAIAMGIVAVFLGLIVAQSHLGYGGSIRMAMVTDNANNLKRAADTDNSAKSEEKQLETLRTVLATLQTERDQLRKQHPWAATTTPEALKAEVANFEGDKLFKRSKQCADVTLPDSRAFCDQVKDARARLANITDMNAKADRINQVVAQIETAQQRVDAKTAAAHQATAPTNDIANQATLGAIVVNWVGGLRGEAALSPTVTQQQAANVFLAVFNSFGMMLTAPALMVAAGFNRIPGALGGMFGPHGGGTHQPAPARSSVPASPGNAPSVPGVPNGALDAIASRRASVAALLAGGRQSRVDGGLLSRAA